MKILVTDFNPFGQDTVNPSIEAVKQLPNSISEAEIIKLEIPIKIQEVQHDYVLHVGQAGGRKTH